jgi:hypothetical protein
LGRSKSDSIEDLDLELTGKPEDFDADEVGLGSELDSEDDFHDTSQVRLRRTRQSPDTGTHLSKRRKISGPAADALEEILPNDSPASQSSPAQNSRHHRLFPLNLANDTNSHLDLDDDLGDDLSNHPSPGPSVPDPITPKLPNRFKLHPHHQNLKSTPSSEPPAAQNPFKPLPRPNPHPFPSNPLTALPEIFSPSRRRGKKEYLPGGLADTVRNWILQAAVEETQCGKTKLTVLNVDVSSVGVVVMDSSRRGILVRDTSGDGDGDGREWLLVGEQQGGNSGSSDATVKRIRLGNKVVVKGTFTNWSVRLKDGDGEREVKVAAQWSVDETET